MLALGCSVDSVLLQEPGPDVEAEAREDKSDTGRHRHPLCLLSKSPIDFQDD